MGGVRADVGNMTRGQQTGSARPRLPSAPDGLRGAVEDTEETIEGRRLETAQPGAFGGLVVVPGLGTSVVALARGQPHRPSWAPSCFLCAGAPVAVRSLIQQRLAAVFERLIQDLFTPDSDAGCVVTGPGAPHP